MKRALIIAEAGVNHNGDFDIAQKLIDAASSAKVDVVKFQTFKTEKLVSRNAQKATYQNINVKSSDNSQFSMLKKLELPEEWHYQLSDYAASKGLVFLSTGFDLESLDFLFSMNPPFFKIPSGEITNKIYLKHVAHYRKPLILSTGMCTMDEIQNAITVLEENGLLRKDIKILHCNTEYPTPFEDVNLRAMLSIKEKFGVEIGYSDHTLGIEVALAAVTLGASVIEKHFTLSRGMEGPDHAASLEPDELKLMVEGIRNVEKALSGDGEKKPSKSEEKNKIAARKSIYFSRNVDQGIILKMDDLEVKRPGDGISPMVIDQVVGKKTQRAILEGEKVKWEDIV